MSLFASGKSTAILFGILLCLAAVSVSPATAQRASTGLSGVVTDSTGAVVPNASVTLTSVETAFTRTTRTNEAGAYSFPDLTPGVYDIAAEATAFKKAMVKGITLHVGVPLVQNFGLELGPVSEQVSVTEAAPLMNRTTAEISTVIESKTLTEIPLNGRNFLQLNLLSPGAIRSKNSNTFDAVQIDPTAQSFNVNGQRGDYNLYLLDGVAIKECQHGSNTGAASPMPFWADGR